MKAFYGGSVTHIRTIAELIEYSQDKIVASVVFWPNTEQPQTTLHNLFPVPNNKWYVEISFAGIQFTHKNKITKLSSTKRYQFGDVARIYFIDDHKYF